MISKIHAGIPSKFIDSLTLNWSVLWVQGSVGGFFGFIMDLSVW